MWKASRRVDGAEPPTAENKSPGRPIGPGLRMASLGTNIPKSEGTFDAVLAALSNGEIAKFLATYQDRVATRKTDPTRYSAGPAVLVAKLRTRSSSTDPGR